MKDFNRNSFIYNCIIGLLIVIFFKINSDAKNLNYFIIIFGMILLTPITKFLCKNSGINYDKKVVLILRILFLVIGFMLNDYIKSNKVQINHLQTQINQKILFDNCINYLIEKDLTTNKVDSILTIFKTIKLSNTEKRNLDILITKNITAKAKALFHKGQFYESIKYSDSLLSDKN